jgi:hypothetical protein
MTRFSLIKDKNASGEKQWFVVDERVNDGRHKARSELSYYAEARALWDWLRWREDGYPLPPEIQF